MSRGGFSLPIDPGQSGGNGAIISEPGNTWALKGDGSATFGTGAFTIDPGGNIQTTGETTLGAGPSVTIDDAGNAEFENTITATALLLGTIAAPPTGMNPGQFWLDTTTSAEQPILRVAQVST